MQREWIVYIYRKRSNLRSLFVYVCVNKAEALAKRYRFWADAADRAASFCLLDHSRQSALSGWCVCMFVQLYFD